MTSWWSKFTNRMAVLKSIHGLQDLLLFIAIFAFATSTPLLLRLPLPWLAPFLQWISGRGKAGLMRRPSLSPEKAQQIATYMDGVIQLGRPLIRPGCLTRGLTQYYFLRRAGLDVALYFGTGQVDNAFAAHCWLVQNDEPFLEKTDPRQHFAPIYAIPLEALTS